jgi:DNA-binding SARP family transcriptional activator
VLGPLVVRLGGVPRSVDRPLERALLVRLALADGMPVPDQRLAADLWDDVELARPTEGLRVLASRLRAATDSPESLTRANGGYALSARMTDLVAARGAAERVHAAVRAGDHHAVRTAAGEALSQSRGQSLADLRSVPYAAVEGKQLDSWRVDLQVERLEADLALGAAAEAGRDLEALAAEHPLHERLWCLLALALYRTGSAGGCAESARQAPVSLGVDPAPDTAAMELRLLCQDPALLLAPRQPAVVHAAPVAQPAPGQLPSPLTSFVGHQASCILWYAELPRPASSR